MAMHWVVNSEKQMIYCTDDEGKLNCSIGPDQMWIECLEGVAPGNCKVAGEWPELSLVDGSADKTGPKWDAMRAQRNTRLVECDWTQLSDSPLSEQDKTAWADYRNQLRDLPQNTVDPDEISWPVKP
jgi:hypothetical protein